jgi:hypothetical protein
MSITKAPQAQTALVTAFETVLNHLGPDPVVLQALSSIEGRILAQTARNLATSVSVACPASTALSAFISGALKTANDAVTPAAGLVFVLSTDQDTSDTKFDTAKGAVPAVGDVFAMTSGSAIAYLGTTVAALDTALQPYTQHGYNSNSD